MANFNWAQMLFDEPTSTQGFRTTGNDPLNQISSWYQFGQNLRKGAEARRAKKDAEEMARREANVNRGNNPQVAIGVDANGVYGVSDSPVQPSGGIGVDASGVYGVEQPTGVYGNFSGQVPNSPVVINNNPMGSNPLGDLGKLATTSGLDLIKGLKGDKESDHGINITDQTIGQNYNKRIDGQVGGLNIPRSPQGNSWGQALGNAENNSFSNFTGGSLANFMTPVASGDSAQVVGGATNLSADNPFARSSKYLGADYDKMAYVRQALANGVKNPLVAMLMYDQMIAPLKEEARQDELRNAFYVLQNPESSDQDKMNALALIQYHKKDPYMEENQQMRREDQQMQREANTMRMRDLQSRITDRNFRNLGDYAGMNLEGKSWVRNGDGVDLSNAQPHTIAGLNHISDIFQQMTGKPLIVTSGNDGDMHAGGQFSHGTGWKIDVSGNGLENPEIRHAFIQQCQNLGIEVLDEYEHPSANSTGGHLDLQFSGYRGNVKVRPRSNGNRYTNGTSSYGNTKIKDMTEKEYGSIKTAVENLGTNNSAESAQALIDVLKNEYGRILYKEGTPAKAINKLYDDLSNGRFGKLNQNEQQIKNIVASVYASVAGGMDERERAKHEEIAMSYLNGTGSKNEGDKPQQTSTEKKKEVNLAEKAQSGNPNGLDDREQAGALRELDEVRHYDERPTISNLNEVASFVKGDDKIGDGKVGDQIIGMIENAGTSKVTPRRRNRH